MSSRQKSAVIVGDVMARPAPHVRCSDTLVTAARLMRDLEIQSLPICEADGRVIGMLNDRDIVTCCVAEDDDPALVTAREFVEGPPIRVRPWLAVTHALHLMLAQGLTFLPVVEQERLVGYLDLAGVLDAVSTDRAPALHELADVVELHEHRTGRPVQP